MLLTTTSKQTNCLELSDLTTVQTETTTRLFNYDHTFLIAKVGAGKTVCTLTAASELLALGEVSRVLVIAPLKVADNVWQGEHLKWSHLKHLSVSIATGNAKKREAAFASGSAIVVLNIENVPWFVDRYKAAHGFDGLVIDELSKFKSSSGKGFKKLRRRVHDFKWRVGLTGTPVSEDWTGLYSQMMLIDGGAAFGTRHQAFLEQYFYATDYQRRNWELRSGSEVLMVAAMGGTVHTVPDYRDAELPPITFCTETVPLPDDAREIYDAMKKDMLVKIDGGVVTAQNAAVLTGKLAQVANGFIYDTENETTTTLHDAKVTRLREIVAEFDEPVLLAYWFQHDRELLQREFDCPVYGAENKIKTAALEVAWNAGEVPLMMIQPRSGSHGLNLQAGGAVLIWYGPYWSRDLFEQMNGRLHRKGQTRAVEIITIEAANTIDQVITARVKGKGAFDLLLHKHLLA